jgi:NADPH:quinone reductase-like Zn-dependent oxidoreductase
VQAGEMLLVNGAGGVTGGLLVQLAVSKGLKVLATAGPNSAQRVRSYGAAEVLDYHNPGWPDEARRSAGEDGIAAVANAAPGGARIAMTALAPKGRLATITGDPPASERGIDVFNVYVRPDGRRLESLAEMAEARQLSINVSSVFPPADAGRALQSVVSGKAAGATVLRWR